FFMGLNKLNPLFFASVSFAHVIHCVKNTQCASDIRKIVEWGSLGAYKILGEKMGYTVKKANLLFLILILHLITVAHAAKIISNDLDLDDNFGESVDVFQHTAVIGASTEDSQGNDSGAAYIFNYSNNHWLESAKIIPTDAQSDRYFGFPVVIENNRVAVGAIGDSTSGIFSGAVYIFDFNGTDWSQTSKIIADDGDALDIFGFSIDLSGNRLIVGAAGVDDEGTDSGAFYIFEYNGIDWEQEHKVTLSGGTGFNELDEFGYSVSLQGDRALIGTKGADAGGETGLAYIYDYDGTNWNQTIKLKANDRAVGDQFGYSVSLDGDMALIGAPQDDDVFSGSGSAYLFEFDGSTWTEVAKLTSPTGKAFDKFGSLVKLKGNRIMINANDNVSTDSGYSYIYDFDGFSWVQSKKFSVDQELDNNELGYAGGFYDDHVLSGAYNDDSKGAVYSFNLDIIFSNGFE
ncbi:FG-GAP repeat protein, partial [Marinicella gelatinilytica]|uniref:FG-GAP repeat protein n=1 Tax=Marinicella gelatinilytica TaxID=2996017 RepID=UPI002260B944